MNFNVKFNRTIVGLSRFCNYLCINSLYVALQKVAF